jgi:molecular chaperone GrpE
MRIFMSPNSPNNEREQPGPVLAGIETDELGLAGYLLRLSDQADRLQMRLDGLAANVQTNGEHVAALTRHMADPSAMQRLDERLAEVAVGLDTGQERMDDLARQVEALSGTVTKLARTQFKSNTLTENKDQQVTSALATLQDIIARGEEAGRANITQGNARLAELRASARSELAVELLPGVDGLEMALESGQTMLARQRQKLLAAAESAQASAGSEPPRRGTWQRLREAFLGDPLLPQPVATIERSPAEEPENLAALEGWLHGLELVHERFMSLLALEGIQPIEAQGQAFDPRMHNAVQAEERADMRPGTVVQVLRQGYRLRERVLRYAEVVVTRAPRAAADAAQRLAVEELRTSEDELPGTRPLAAHEEQES